LKRRKYVEKSFVKIKLNKKYEKGKNLFFLKEDEK